MNPLEQKLEQIFQIGNIFKVLCFGVFTVGVWVASVQFTLTKVQADVGNLQEEKKQSAQAWSAWREQVNERLATQTEALRNLTEAVNKQGRH